MGAWILQKFFISLLSCQKQRNNNRWPQLHNFLLQRCWGLRRRGFSPLANRWMAGASNSPSPVFPFPLFTYGAGGKHRDRCIPALSLISITLTHFQIQFDFLHIPLRSLSSTLVEEAKKPYRPHRRLQCVKDLGRYFLDARGII